MWTTFLYRCQRSTDVEKHIVNESLPSSKMTIGSTKSNLVLHWDGKKLEDTTNDNLALRVKKVERLAVVVSGINGQKIVTIAKTENGTGVVISDTVYEHVIEWKLLDSVVAICTANTGPNGGSVPSFISKTGQKAFAIFPLPSSHPGDHDWRCLYWVIR